MHRLLLMATLALPAAAAHAADNGFYIGAGVTQSKLNNVGKDFSSSSLDDFDFEDTAWKLVAGFRPLDHLALEANYMDLGSDSGTLGGIRFDADGKAYAGYVVGLIPVAIVDLYAKAGVVHWDTNAHASGITSVKLGDDGNEFGWGAGAQVRFGSLAARLEYEQFDVANSDGVELLSLGATWTFL